MSILEGTILDGRYQLGPELGRGGMSIVRAGHDLQLGRRVAIKLLREPHDAKLAERLFREARAAARTQHPAVALVFAYGTDIELELDYLVMEQLVGEDLAARIARAGPLTLEFVRRLGMELAEVLEAAHEAGVIHRDLKPANVFLAQRASRPEEIKVLDFGVAKLAELQTLTEGDELLGTLAYMAPEQLRNAHDVDERVDVYAVGAVLFECLSGVPPIRARSLPELVLAALAGGVPPVHTLRADAPAALCELVDRCLQAAPRERFPSAAELRRALQQLGG